MNKRAFDKKNLGYAAFNNIPTLGVLGLAGALGGPLLGFKQRHLGLGLPAAYLAYLAGKKGNGGFDWWDGVEAIDKPAYMLNKGGWMGLGTAGITASIAGNIPKENRMSDVEDGKRLFECLKSK